MKLYQLLMQGRLVFLKTLVYIIFANVNQKCSKTNKNYVNWNKFCIYFVIFVLKYGVK